MLRARQLEGALKTFIGGGLDEVHLVMDNGTHIASAHQDDAPLTDRKESQVCALAFSSWAELSKAGAHTLPGIGALDWLTVQGSSQTLVCGPVGGGAPFLVVGLCAADSAVPATKERLAALRDSLREPLTAVASALVGDMASARRRAAQAAAQATGAAGPGIVGSRGEDSVSPDAEGGEAGDDGDDEDAGDDGGEGDDKEDA